MEDRITKRALLKMEIERIMHVYSYYQIELNIYFIKLFEDLIGPKIWPQGALDEEVQGLIAGRSNLRKEFSKQVWAWAFAVTTWSEFRYSCIHCIGISLV